jgi:osmotically-inducible protein OsmY
MLYLVRFAPMAAFALIACAGQKTRPPPDEPRTTSVTSAALTTAPAEAEPTTQRTPDPPVAPMRPLPPKFRAALVKNPTLESYLVETISIEQDDGHVTMRGYMPTVADKVQAELSVRSVPGVTSVTNLITTLH